MEQEETSEGLHRVIGVKSLASNVINNTVGAGIFVLPAIVASQLGASGILSYLLCAILIAFVILCYIEIGKQVTTSGGSYAYVEHAFGPFAGFLTNSLFLLGYSIASDAAIMNALTGMLFVLFPAIANPVSRISLFILIIGGLAFFNLRGASQGVRIVNISTFAKMIPLLLLVLVGFTYVSWGNLTFHSLPSLRLTGDTVLVLFFAFAGFETPLNASGEIKNPRKTMPAGLLVGIFIVLIFYLSIQTVAQGVLGAQLPLHKDAPLAFVAEKIAGPAGSVFILIASVISMFGTVGSDVFATPRLLFAGARDKLFPAFLAKVHPRFATPYLSIIVYSILIFIFSVSGGFRQLAILSSAALLVIYLAVILAMVKLKLRSGKEIFKSKAGMIIPLIAIFLIVWLLSHLSKAELLSIVIFIAVFSGIYGLMKIAKKKVE